MKQNLVNIGIIICVMIPAPFVLTGKVVEAQFAFGFTMIMFANLARDLMVSIMAETFRSHETAFNVWLGLMVCQVAFAINASLKLEGSFQPGIAMCIAGIIVSQILTNLSKKRDMKETGPK